jgi:hypothetical protein
VDAPAIILTVDPDHCLATWDRTLIQIWRRATTEKAVANACAVARTFAAKDPRGTTLLSIVERTSDIPGAKARAEFARFGKESARRMACCVLVPEGGGLRLAIVRSVAASLAALTGQAFPYQFSEDVDAALTLLRPHLAPSAGGPDALRRALITARAQIARTTSLGR